MQNRGIMNKMKNKVFQICLGLVLCAQAAFAKVTASVDNDVVGVGEKIVLSIHCDENVSARPDLSVLQNLFNVTSTSVSNQTYIINGQINNEVTWQFSLLPLQKGKLIIGPISVGKDKTNALEITVTDEPLRYVKNKNEEYQTSEPLYQLKTEVVGAQKTPFIQEQINYAVRFIDGGEVQIESLSFEETDDFIILETQKPTVQRTSEGKRLTTFFYALFAQKSGELTLPKAHLQGFVYAKPNNADSFFQNGFFGMHIPSFFGVNEPLSIASETQKINILPVPQEYMSGWWVPAKDVSLQAHFTNITTPVRVGDVLKREIELKAVGLTSKQLPEIETFVNKDLKKYGEQPQGETVVKNSEVIGNMVISDVYIPQKAGQITFPEMKIDWYDVKTGQIKQAALKEETIVVYPNENLKTTDDAPQEQMLDKKDKTDLANDKQKTALNQYLFVLAAFVCGMLFCYFMLKPKKRSVKKEKVISERDIFNKSGKKNFKLLRDNLILWAQTHYPDKQISNLQDVSRIFNDEELTKAIDNLCDALYSEHKENSFNIKLFRKIFKKTIKQKHKSEKNSHTPIPPLYS